MVVGIDDFPRTNVCRDRQQKSTKNLYTCLRIFGSFPFKGNDDNISSHSHRMIHMCKDKNLTLTESNVYKNQSLIIDVATMDLVFDITSFCGERLVKGLARSSNTEHSRVK